MRGSICSVRVRLSHLSVEVFFGCCSFYALQQQNKNRKGRAMLQMNDHMCTGVMFTNERFLYRKGLVVNVF